MRRLLKTLIFALYSLCVIPSIYAYETGLDILAGQLKDPSQTQPIIQTLENKKIAVLAHAASITKNQTHLIDVLYPRFKVQRIFAPEHGLRSLEDHWIDDGIDEKTKLPVTSLYKRAKRAPSPTELEGIEILIIDLFDVGVRPYTYFATVAEVLKVAAEAHVEVMILDRPNPLGLTRIEGLMLDSSLVGHISAYHPIPYRHGLTLGMWSKLFDREVLQKNGHALILNIVNVKNWNNESTLLDNDRPWIPPSPALQSREQTMLYALWGTLENFNLSVGRGTTNELAFRVFGAPWISQTESQVLAKEINKLGLMKVEPFSWMVTRAQFVGERAYGVRVKWEDTYIHLRTDQVTYEIIRTIYKLFKNRITTHEGSVRALGSKAVLEMAQKNKPWRKVRRMIRKSLRSYSKRILP